MSEIISENIYIIILLPLWISLIVLLGRFFSVYVNKTLTHILSLLVSAIGAIVTLTLFKLFTPDMVYENVYPFIKINDLILPFGIYIDRLSLVFASVLFLASFLVQLFCISYMKEEPKQYRFYALLNLFNFALAGLFFSPNLFQTYVFWEIAGIISYLLIGFEYNKPEKTLASKKVFIMNRIGDTAFLCGIIMCSYLLYEYAPLKSLSALSFYDMNTVTLLIGAYTSSPLFYLICSLFIIAAMVKSAQIPFYTWLQDAMEAKLPVSALLHSATLVALGVYLIIRMIPLFLLDNYVLEILIDIGLLTALVCSLAACAQTNSKKALAYSTSAQLGLMFFAAGMLNIKVCVALFCAHAFIKAMLFITLPDENKKWGYTKLVFFLIGGLSLSGLFPAGMITKEMLAFNLGTTGKIVLSLISFLTAFYITRIAVVIADKNGHEKSQNNFTELVSMFGFLALNIALYISLRKFGEYRIDTPFYAAATAWIVVYVLYIKQAFFKVPYLYNLCLNGFYLDKFYMNFVAGCYEKVTKILGIFDNDILANYKPWLFISKTGVKIIYWIEENIMNKSISLTADISRRISAISKQLQTKNVQWYNFYGFIIITTIISCLVLAYVAILIYIRGV